MSRATKEREVLCDACKNNAHVGGHARPVGGVHRSWHSLVQLLTMPSELCDSIDRPPDLRDLQPLFDTDSFRILVVVPMCGDFMSALVLFVLVHSHLTSSGSCYLRQSSRSLVM